eukprot:TRINITY_DN9094_c0_g1_i1.p1 TRINITY_DN9094_c0_g1~~TRINITY_DN9094_c0_g1_i1.p1  ORF type:complete len:217 (+),score=33.63 TRINITY_DN9094_c0_g1_i1:24-674(+)
MNGAATRRAGLLYGHLHPFQTTTTDIGLMPSAAAGGGSSAATPHLEPIDNYYNKDPDFKCFGCSTHNPHGLHLIPLYDEASDEVVAHFTASDHMVSFPNVVHGGILSVLVDDIAYWALQQKLKRLALTTKAEITYTRVTRPNEELTVRAKVAQTEGPKAIVAVTIRNHKGQECAQAKVHFFLAKPQALKAAMGPAIDKYLPFASPSVPTPNNPPAN